MSEAPKKIWAIQGTHHPYWRLKEFPNTVQYIRADHVDGLVEALKEVDYVLDIFSAFGQSDLQRKVQDALKALEEE